MKVKNEYNCFMTSRKVYNRMKIPPLFGTGEDW